MPEQVRPQSIPAGAEVTEPEPVPGFATVSVYVSANVAVTDCTEVTVTEHVPVPVHAPDQPVKVEPGEGVAVRVTTVLLAKL